MFNDHKLGQENEREVEKGKKKKGGGNKDPRTYP
jgi:hypothetical protein